MCSVRKETALPMMYISDCIRAAIMPMKTATSKLNYYDNYNIAAKNFYAEELTSQIKKYCPGFICGYELAFR